MSRADCLGQEATFCSEPAVMRLSQPKVVKVIIGAGDFALLRFVCRCLVVSHTLSPPFHIPPLWTSFPHAPHKIPCLAVSVTSFTGFDPPLRAAYLQYFHLSHAPPPRPLPHSPGTALTSHLHTCLLEFASM